MDPSGQADEEKRQKLRDAKAMISRRAAVKGHKKDALKAIRSNAKLTDPRAGVRINPTAEVRWPLAPRTVGAVP